MEPRWMLRAAHMMGRELPQPWGHPPALSTTVGFTGSHGPFLPCPGKQLRLRASHCLPINSEADSVLFDVAAVSADKM